MKLTMLSVDWKEDFDGGDITQVIKDVGGKKLVYNYDQNTADDKITYFSSHPLTTKQLDELWEKGDFYTGDRVWSGKDFKDILKKIIKYVENEEIRCEMENLQDEGMDSDEAYGIAKERILSKK